MDSFKGRGRKIGNKWRKLPRVRRKIEEEN